MKKLVVTGLILTLILGFLLGGAVGLFAGVKFGTELGDFAKWGAMGNYSIVVSQRYATANYEEAKEILSEYIAFWEKFHGYEGSFVPEKSYFWDTGMSYARLALLEEKFGSEIQRDQYFEEAQERLKQAGMKDYSLERIRTFIQKVDEDTKFGSK